jgi:hypothetical protein
MRERVGRPGRKADAAVPPAARPARTQAAPGGGRPLQPGVRTEMEGRLGHDFGSVRIHDDARAAASAERLNARAYTVGEHVVFGGGEFAPSTPTGERLLAHELAHVVQQSARPSAAGPVRLGRPGDAAERAADEAASTAGRPGAAGLAVRDRLLASAPSGPVLQRAVKTWGGEFDTDKYDIVKNAAGTEAGLEIDLRFKPGKPVNAKKIGMVQTANSRHGGKSVFPSTNFGARAIPAGKPGEGAAIDRVDNYANPLYATDAPAAKDTLASTPTSAGWGQHGWRYRDTRGKLQTQDALLKDAPMIDPPGKNAGQTFESTALAVEGKQEGTYYGSVQWGWETDAAGTFKKLPLTLVSSDVPSAEFEAATELWNTSKTAAGDETLDLPVVSGKYTSTAGVWLVSNPAKYKDTIIKKLPKNTRVEVTSKATSAAFNAGTHKWWKVTVVDGVHVGKVGWIMESLLADVKAAP